MTHSWSWIQVDAFWVLPIITRPDKWPERVLALKKAHIIGIKWLASSLSMGYVNRKKYERHLESNNFTSDLTDFFENPTGAKLYIEHMTITTKT